MADANLPNSHPTVTPDWMPLPFSRTPFIDSIQTKRANGHKDTRYAGFAPPDWCTGGGRTVAVHGGFCAATMLVTALNYSRDLSGGTRALDPLHIHIDYLTPVPKGAFQVTVRELHRAGSGSMTLQTELVAPGADGPAYCIAIIRLGKLQMPPDGKSIQSPIGPLPNRERDCRRGANAPFYFVIPPTSSIRAYLPKDGEDQLWSPTFGGRSTRYQWSKLDDERLFQTEHILLLVDLVPAIPFNFENRGVEISAMKYATPTVSLTVNIYEKVKDVEWLLTRAHMKRLHNGRCDMDVQIINEEEKLVASSTQVVAIIPRKQPKQAKASVL